MKKKSEKEIIEFIIGRVLHSHRYEPLLSDKKIKKALEWLYKKKGKE